MDKEFSNKLTFLRFLMSLVVVASHAATFTKLNTPLNSIEFVCYKLFYVINPLVNIALAFFFLTSAFLFYSTLTSNNIKEKVFKRFKSLLVPYLLWQFIGIFINFTPVTIEGFLNNVGMSKYYGGMWFIEFLFIFTLLAPIIKFSVRNKWVGLTIFCLITFIQCFGIIDYRYFTFLSDSFARYLNRSLSFFYIYYLGAYLGTHFASFITRDRYTKYIKLSAFLLFLYLIFLDGYSGFIYHILLVVCPLLLFVFVDKKWFKRKPKWYIECSFWIYAIHPLALSGVRRIVMAFGLLNEEIVLTQVNPIYALEWRTIMTIATIIISLISGYIMIKFFPKIYEILTGGRLPVLEGNRGESNGFKWKPKLK